MAENAFCRGIELDNSALVVHGHDAIQGRIEDCTRALVVQRKLCGAFPDAHFELVPGVAQCPLGAASACKVPADRKQRKSNNSAREETTPDNDRLSDRGAAFSPLFALLQQGHLDVVHPTDEVANLVVESLAFSREDLALRCCKA